MDTVEDLKREARSATKWGNKVSWRENEQRLIWCGMKEDGSFVFRNTTSASKRGPIISETVAAKFLADEGPWIRSSNA